MKPRWQDLPNKQNMSVDELSGVVGPALNDIKKMLGGKLSIEDNQLAAIVSRQTTHLTTFRIKNPLPFGTRVRGVRALRSILSNGTSGLPVDSIEWDYAGDDIVMSVEFAPPQGYCAVVLNTARTTTTATEYKINWDAQQYAPVGGIAHSTSTNPTRMTFDRNGVVRLIGNVVWEFNATGFRESYFLVNGAARRYAYAHIPSSSSFKPGMTISVDINVVSGDYVELATNQNSGGNLGLEGTSNEHCFMSAEFISPTSGYSADVNFVIEGG